MARSAGGTPGAAWRPKLLGGLRWLTLLLGFNASSASAAKVGFNASSAHRLLTEDRSPDQVVADARAAQDALEARVQELYGVPARSLAQTGVKWFAKRKDEALVARLLRAMVKRDNFVVVVGGMSDTAGHGNRHQESYPIVMLDALKPVFAAAGVELVVRNMAMGGVPSFPNSVCMKDAFGADTDLLVWDFRMVERDEVKGELYLRHALYLPRQAFVMFKRQNAYLNKLAAAYGDPSALHVVDETELFNKLHQSSNAVKSDSFCRTACSCPGQVRWHSGWKMHRLRGLQMAVLYGRVLAKAVEQYHALAARGPIDASAARWDLARLPVPEPVGAQVKSGAAFAGQGFECAISWQPKEGRGLRDILDTSSEAKGGTQWKFKDANKRISDAGAKCGYQDNKEALEGTVNDGWVFFKFDVAEHGTIGFCADFPKDKRLLDFAFLVLINGEEVQSQMAFWHDSRTLGVSLQCYGTDYNVRTGSNSLGFRVMEHRQTLRLTHVVWSGPAAQ